MHDVGFGIAFVAGLVSFFSPCVFPLVPAYLAQLTGGNIANQQLQVKWNVVMSRSIGFVLGFSLIFLLLGASSAYIGKIFFAYRDWVEKIGGIVIVLFGLQMTGVLSLRFLMREKRADFGTSKNETMSFFRSALMGLAFGAGWSPCIGLVLSSILILASQGDTMWEGVRLLLVYSGGLGVPFLLIAALWTQSLQRIRQMNKWLPMIQKVSGGLMIILGVLLFTGLFKQISFYFSKFPPLW
ncbi:cytochrome c biogenesis protein CcdA [Ammoniphilus oxalaticus]|uniref:Cytochrome c biogenesis protein CcdA n=1 Tax=Ammoniphilus oxalaticus TaxID=66863 RepID=A0A419SKI9_9BACL|nr:cytochrome c biogenesis protein CcdA [Ammoniphilus oxalaticus]RKD24534.1 cytochrome c biogenesis protein CcdA [Ammoniphilus oxalaticus]